MEGRTGLNAADATPDICLLCGNSITVCTDVNLQNIHKKRKHIVTGHVDNSKIIDHFCVRNYDGSSGAMESDGLLLILIELYKKYGDNIYIETVVTDDDTKIKKYLTYPRYKRRGWKNHGGCLPLHITEPKWFADPTHRAKCVAGVFFRND